MENGAKTQVAPYYQFFSCAPQMFRDHRTRDVFEYLFSVWLCRFRQGKHGPFTYTVRNISIQANINRAGVMPALEELCAMDLISLDGANCCVNAAYFFAVVDLYNCAKSAQRAQIKQAFLQHNLNDLTELGLVKYDPNMIYSTVAQIAQGCLNQATLLKTDNLVQNEQGCSKQATMSKMSNVAQNEHTLLKTNIVLEAVETFFASISVSDCLNQATLSEKIPATMSILSNMATKSFSETDDEDKNQLIKSLLDLGINVFLLNYAQNEQLGVSILSNTMLKMNNSNINKINIKENVEDERSESSYIGGVEKDKEGMGEEGKDEGGFEGLEIIELKSPISEKERYSQYKKEKPYINVYRNKPYFSERDMEKITGDLYECTKSPVKLFIYNLWDGLYEWYQEEIEDKLPVDEYGEPLKSESEKSDLDMLRSIISQTMFARIVKQAWYETEGQIESKMFQTENENVPIEIEELPDIHLENLIDWKEAVNENGEHGFVVSLEGFRNIEADDVTEVKQPKSREEKKAMNRINRQFLAAVMTTDDSQLTPIEALIKDFTSKFIILDEHYHVEGFANGRGDRMDCSFLPGYLIKPWMVKVLESGLKPEEFYETFNLPEYKDGSNLHMAATIFSYQKVQRCNEMRGFQSIISEETLRNAPSLDD